MYNIASISSSSGGGGGNNNNNNNNSIKMASHQYHQQQQQQQRQRQQQQPSSNPFDLFVAAPNQQQMIVPAGSSSNPFDFGAMNQQLPSNTTIQQPLPPHVGIINPFEQFAMTRNNAATAVAPPPPPQQQQLVLHPHQQQQHQIGMTMMMMQHPQQQHPPARQMHQNMTAPQQQIQQQQQQQQPLLVMPTTTTNNNNTQKQQQQHVNPNYSNVCQEFDPLGAAAPIPSPPPSTTNQDLQERHPLAPFIEEEAPPPPQQEQQPIVQRVPVYVPVAVPMQVPMVQAAMQPQLQPPAAATTYANDDNEDNAIVVYAEHTVTTRRSSPSPMPADSSTQEIVIATPVDDLPAVNNTQASLNAGMSEEEALCVAIAASASLQPQQQQQQQQKSRPREKETLSDFYIEALKGVEAGSKQQQKASHPKFHLKKQKSLGIASSALLEEVTENMISYLITKTSATSDRALKTQFYRSNKMTMNQFKAAVKQARHDARVYKESELQRQSSTLTLPRY